MRRAPTAQTQLVVLGLAVALAASVVVWLLVRDDGNPGVSVPTGRPVLVTQAQLERVASSTHYPVYWAGPREGFSYELTRTSGGRFFVRYLPPGVTEGDPRPSFLVIGTYARPHGFADLRRASRRAGTVSVGLDRGGLVVFAAKHPQSVYFGYPDAQYQVEVFDPSGDTARKLVLAGTIRPVS
jgi:hypothetical protein